MTEKNLTAENAKTLFNYKREVYEELISILSYWIKFTIDDKLGGFYGSVNNDNIPDESASKGIVLNSRILWAFSAAFLNTKNSDYLKIAERAYQYILNFFTDKEYEGVYWSVDASGKMLDGKKQIYGIAFCIYGMSEYYKATQNKIALNTAIKLFRNIERHSFDKVNGGYLEAFTREWNNINDLRLSEKDENERKTMNTHLHIIEAYSNLYQVWTDEQLKNQIRELLQIFDKYFINSETYHLNLFADDNWNIKSQLNSFGHDIEAAWLLQECAENINDEFYIDRFKELAIKIANAAVEGLDNDGGLWYEYEVLQNHLIKEKHWWSQAEAMIGFYNAYQVSGDKKYLQYSLNSWSFIKDFIKDKKKGEWLWGVNEDYSIIQKDKAGFWKCPYHNTRACLEIIKRIESL